MKSIFTYGDRYEFQVCVEEIENWFETSGHIFFLTGLDDSVFIPIQEECMFGEFLIRTIMVWAGIGLCGRPDVVWLQDNLNAEQDCGEVCMVIPHRQRFSQEFMLMHDKASHFKTGDVFVQFHYFIMPSLSISLSLNEQYKGFAREKSFQRTHLRRVRSVIPQATATPLQSRR